MNAVRAFLDACRKILFHYLLASLLLAACPLPLRGCRSVGRRCAEAPHIGGAHIGHLCGEQQEKADRHCPRRPRRRPRTRVGLDLPPHCGSCLRYCREHILLLFYTFITLVILSRVLTGARSPPTPSTGRCPSIFSSRSSQNSLTGRGDTFEDLRSSHAPVLRTVALRTRRVLKHPPSRRDAPPRFLPRDDAIAPLCQDRCFSRYSWLHSKN